MSEMYVPWDSEWLEALDHVDMYKYAEAAGESFLEDAICHSAIMEEDTLITVVE